MFICLRHSPAFASRFLTTASMLLICNLRSGSRSTFRFSIKIPLTSRQHLRSSSNGCRVSNTSLTFKTLTRTLASPPQSKESFRLCLVSQLPAFGRPEPIPADWVVFALPLLIWIFLNWSAHLNQRPLMKKKKDGLKKKDLRWLTSKHLNLNTFQLHFLHRFKPWFLHLKTALFHFKNLLHWLLLFLFIRLVKRPPFSQNPNFPSRQDIFQIQVTQAYLNIWKQILSRGF